MNHVKSENAELTDLVSLFDEMDFTVKPMGYFGEGPCDWPCLSVKLGLDEIHHFMFWAGDMHVTEPFTETRDDGVIVYWPDIAWSTWEKHVEESEE